MILQVGFARRGRLDLRPTRRRDGVPYVALVDDAGSEPAGPWRGGPDRRGRVAPAWLLLQWPPGAAAGADDDRRDASVEMLELCRAPDASLWTYCAPALGPAYWWSLDGVFEPSGGLRVVLWHHPGEFAQDAERNQTALDLLLEARARGVLPGLAPVPEF